MPAKKKKTDNPLAGKALIKEVNRRIIDRNLLIQGFLSGRRSCGV